MASEKQVNILMKLLDEALKEVDQIEIKLSSYEEMLQSVKEQMDQISESNHLIHLSYTNNVKLLSEIEYLVVSSFIVFTVPVQIWYKFLLSCYPLWYLYVL